MCHVNFHCICSALHCTDRCISISFNKLIYLLCRNCFRNVSSISRCNSCCCLDWCSRILGISFRSGILKLNGNLSTFCMTGIGNLFQTLNAVVIIQTRFSRAALCSFMDNCCFDRDQAKLTFCTFSIVCNRLIAPCSICICKVISHWWYYKAVLYCHWSDLNRRKHIFELHYFFPLSFEQI